VGPSAAGPPGAAEGGGAGVTADKGVLGAIVVAIVLLEARLKKLESETDQLREQLEKLDG
jgi:hypothetical protein